MIAQIKSDKADPTRVAGKNLKFSRCAKGHEQKGALGYVPIS